MNTLITNIGQLVTPGGRGPVEGKEMGRLTVLDGAEMRLVDERIAEIGAAVDHTGIDVTIDAMGGVALPGFVDPHTHAVFAATREEEFLSRIQGTPYSEGGIQSSARAVAAVDEDLLAEAARPFLDRMLACGTTTVEVKSGYGLSVEGEMKLLLAIRRLRKLLPMRIVPTFLGAHAFPEEMRRDDYISMIITQMIPIVRRRRLAAFCDVFCDQGFYTPAEARTILRAARGAGLRLKLHADELADVGGAALAAELEATSADHLLCASEKGLTQMRRAGVIPVLLPGTAFTLGAPYAAARRMIALGLAVALATDFNPGTCLIHSMATVVGLAVMKMGMTAEEAITAATLNAACALDLAEEIGSLEVGKRADVAILDLETYRQIPYFFAHNLIRSVIQDGKTVYEACR